MIPALFITSTYIILIGVGYKQTVRVRDFLLQSNATTPEQGVFIDRQRYFLLTTKFFFSAVKELPDGRVWVDMNQWRPMLIIFGIFCLATLVSLLGLFLLYI